MAGQNPAAVAVMKAILPGMAVASVPGAYGLYDLFTGETNGMNSGEIPLDAALALAPHLGGAVGYGLSGINDPVRRSLDRTSMGAEADRNQRLADLVMRGYERQDPALGATATATQNIEEALARLQERHPELRGGQLMELAQRNSLNRGRIGALLGATAAGIPAVMAMMDASQTESPLNQA